MSKQIALIKFKQYCSEDDSVNMTLHTSVVAYRNQKFCANTQEYDTVEEYVKAYCIDKNIDFAQITDIKYNSSLTVDEFLQQITNGIVFGDADCEWITA